MNWSELHPVRRRHLRRAARDRGPARVLPRVHVPRPVDLRLGPAAEAGPPRHDLGRRDRHRALRLLHPGRELLDAAPGRATRSTAAAGRAELTDFLAVLTNNTALITFPHTITAAFMTAGAFVLGDRALACWPRPATDAGAVPRGREGGRDACSSSPASRVARHRRPAGQAHDRAAADEDGRRRGALRDRAAARRSRSSRSARSTASQDVFSIRIPYLLSFLATGTFDGKVEGINDLQAQYEAQYGPGDYTPNIPVTYWTFRLMIGVGVLAAAAAALVPVARSARAGRPAARRRRRSRSRCRSCRSPRTRRLDLHRDGPPAVDRVRPACRPRPRLAERQRRSVVLITLVGFTLLYGVPRGRRGRASWSRRVRGRACRTPTADQRVRARGRARARTSRTEEHGHGAARPLWFVAHRRPLDRLLRPRGLRLRRRHPAAASSAATSPSGGR